MVAIKSDVLTQKPKIMPHKGDLIHVQECQTIKCDLSHVLLIEAGLGLNWVHQWEPWKIWKSSTQLRASFNLPRRGIESRIVGKKGWFAGRVVEASNQQGLSCWTLWRVTGQTHIVPHAQCALHIAHCTGHIVHCTGHIVHCTGHNVHCTGHNVHCTGQTHIAHCTGHIAQGTLDIALAHDPTSHLMARSCFLWLLNNEWAETQGGNWQALSSEVGHIAILEVGIMIKWQYDKLIE